jgi:hypothetical protein
MSQRKLRESFESGLGKELSCVEEKHFSHLEFQIQDKVPISDIDRAKRALESLNEKINYHGETLSVVFRNSVSDLELYINFLGSTAQLSLTEALNLDCSPEDAEQRGLNIKQAFYKLKEELISA